MCGICGFSGFNDRRLIRKMCDIIRHRGPDDEGFYSDRNVELGMRRLSIIDLEGGHQPVHNEDESIWIVFNGEIYNFQSLKGDLEKKGHKFYTNSDTETIVHCYEEYGEDFANRLDGMFALAIWDSKEKKLVLARDRFGKKPLYYTTINGSLVFGSEIKSLLLHESVRREVDRESLAYFLKFGYVPSEKTMFKNIFKLMGGHMLVYKSGKISIRKYWELKADESKGCSHSERFYVEQFRNLFEGSVKKRLISDVPLGVFLSGGLDSSSITAIMSKHMSEPVKTFSIGFEGDKWDESRYSDFVSDYLGTDHKKIMLDSGAIRSLPEVIWHMDEPIADPASIPTYHLSEFAGKKVKACLVGEGADEILGGYKHHMLLNAMKGINMPGNIRTPLSELARRIDDKTSVKSKIKRYTRFASLLLSAGNLQKIYANMYEKLPEKEYLLSGAKARDIYGNLLKSNADVLKQLLLFETNVQLQNSLLMKVDKLTMSASVEARVPFLDYMLVEFCAALPDNMKIRGFTNKYVLRKSMQNALPKEIIKRRKHSFSVPIINWINEGFKDYAKQILSEENIRKRGYFNYSRIEKTMSTEKNYGLLWPFLVFELWHRTFIDREKVERPLRLDELISL